MTRAEMRRAAQQSGRRRAGNGSGPGGPGGPGGRGPGGPGRRGAAAGPPPKKRFIDYPRWGKTGVHRWLPSWKQVIGGCLIFFGGLVGVVGVAYATTPMPDWQPNALAQSNIYEWSDGSKMATVGQVNRQNVTLDDVPLKVRQDFMAAENATFYQDSGVDFQGIARAVFDMVKGGELQSGSTITQQFVKNSILQNQSQTFSRKFTEILTSIKISQPGSSLTKDQIFAGYLNTNYYGRGAYGIQAAAQAYFGIDASKLNVAQGAFLAASVNQPSLFQNVDTDPTAKSTAVARWQYVIGRMQKDNWLTPQEAAQYTAASFPKVIAWHQNSSALTGQIGYLKELADNYVTSHSSVTDAELANGGYTIKTTFDKNKTAQLTKAVEQTTQKLLPPSQPINKNVQFGASSIDPATGDLVAIYGGPGYDKGYFIDNANQPGGVQVGSTFKPIVLASAMTNGATLSPGAAPSPITPDSMFDADNGIKIKDINGTYIGNKQAGTVDSDKTDDGYLHQQNDVPTMYGYRTLRFAMMESINTPYVQLGEYTGYDNVAKTAEDMGVPKTMLTSPSAGFYIGTSSITPIRMADVYATLDNQGVQRDPISVLSVKGPNGPVTLNQPKAHQALDSNIANNITDVLKDVVEAPGGTGYAAKVIGPYVAGKTGTTDEYKSAWFIGYTKSLVTSVTMFKEDPKKKTLEGMGGVGGQAKTFGGTFPATVWTDFMQDIGARGDQPFPSFTKITGGANENGAPASPTAAPSATASSTPTASATPTKPGRGNQPTNAPTATSSCFIFCSGNGGATGGTGGAGGAGGTTPTPTGTGTATAPVGGPGRGNGGGGVQTAPAATP